MANATERPRRKRLSWESRCEIVSKVIDDGLDVQAVVERFGVHRSTVYRLLARYRTGGWETLKDQRPVPRRQPRRLSLEGAADGVASVS